MKFNLNFASNENWVGAKLAWQWLYREKNWRLGHEQEELAELLAQKFKSQPEKVFFTLAARSLLHQLLLSLELPAESEVLVQAFTCEAVVLPVIEAGLKPIYVDLEPVSWSMNGADLKKKASKKARVLILQYTFGMLPRDRQEILIWANKQNIVVIEDLAHGFAPALLEKKEQTIKLLSFGRSKFFSSVHGGALVLNNAQIAQKMEQQLVDLPMASKKTIKKALWYKILTPAIKQLGFVGKVLHKLMLQAAVFNREISKRERAGDYDLWLDRQLPNVFAALVLEQVKNYQPEWQQRQMVAACYQQELAGELLDESLPGLRYPVLVKEPEQVLAKLKERGFILGDWYRQVVAPVGLDLQKVQYELGSCPLAEIYSQQVINLPLNVSLELAGEMVFNLKEILHAS